VRSTTTGDANRQRLLIQERLDLQAALEASDAGTDLVEPAAEFVVVAASYGQRKGITDTAWRELGMALHLSSPRQGSPAPADLRKSAPTRHS